MGVQYMSYKIFGWPISAERFFDAATQFLDDKFDIENEIIDMHYDNSNLWKLITPSGTYVYMEGSYYEKSSSWNLYVSVIEYEDDPSFSRNEKIKNLTPEQIKTAKDFAQKFSYIGWNPKELGDPKKFDLFVVF